MVKQLSATCCTHIPRRNDVVVLESDEMRLYCLARYFAVVASTLLLWNVQEVEPKVQNDGVQEPRKSPKL